MPQPTKSRSQYKKYNTEQVAQFVDLLQEQGLSVMKAAERSGIPRSTAYELRKQFNKTGQLPSKGRVVIEIPEGYSQMLIDYMDQNPKAQLRELQDQFNRATIDDTMISKVRLRSLIEQTCAFSLEEQYPVNPLQKPSLIVDWDSCMFIDEIHFTLRPWVQRSEKGIDVALLGCISSKGPLDVVKLGPTEPRLEILFETMKRLDLHYIVLNPERVRSIDIQKELDPHTSCCFFLSPSDWNPMQACWSKVKSNIVRVPLDAENLLSPRIRSAWNTVTPDDCARWIKESQNTLQC